MAVDLVVRGERVVTPEGVRPAAVVVEGGVIAGVVEPTAAPGAARVVDAGAAVVSPGIVDGHVHVNEPGRTDWEGFETATRAAAAGGVTTIVDMPLNCVPPTTTVAALDAKRAVAAPKAHVDVAFWGGAVPGNTGELRVLHEAGVAGFKCFLADSGVAEYAPLDAEGLVAAMAEIAALGALLIVHAESAAVLAEASPPPPAYSPAYSPADPPADSPADSRVGRRADSRAGSHKYATYLATRPAAAEVAAVTDVVSLVEETGCRAHILHLSSADALGVLADARARGLPVTAETCPHYLALSAEQVPDGATAYKCAPPIRDSGNQDRLWDALAAGLVDAVVSDHSPCPPGLKLPGEGDFLRAWGGVSSLQLGLPVVWTAARARGFGIEDLARWMSAGPARVAGLAAKGAIAAGRDADLVIWDPDSSFVVEPERLEHRHPVTPYAGMRLDGVVEATFVAGAEAYRRGHVSADPVGRLLPAPR